MRFPWPWKKVEALEEAEEQAETPVSLDDGEALGNDGGEAGVSGEVERAIRQTQQTMSDGLDRLREALAELEAQVHAIRGDGQ